jgi:glycosyltransferase involved in cell wall biosynthesis
MPGGAALNVRVLVVSSYPPRHCGIGAHARDQVRRLRAEGHEVTVLSPLDGEGDVRTPFFGGRPFWRAARRGGHVDRIVVHFQPALYYRPRAPISKVLTSVGLLWLVTRRKKTEILVHEADAPVRWRPDYALLRMAFRQASMLFFHTRAERDALERDYRIRVRGQLFPHRVEPVGPMVSREDARARLGLVDVAEPLFLCAGFIQPSKGFDRALGAFGEAGGGSLYMVGSVRDDTPANHAYVEELRQLCAVTPGAILVERFVDDLEFDLWVAAADWVVIAYRRSWSSGVLARAHAMGTPAVATAEGGLAEQAGPGDMVVKNDVELAAALRERVASAAGAKR